MNIARALLLFVATLALSGCATLWRPQAVSVYSCINTDVRFTVHYSWRPPLARFELEGQAPVDLTLVPGMQQRRPGYYVFGDSDGAIRLTVEGDRAYLTRRGERWLQCGAEVIVVT